MCRFRGARRDSRGVAARQLGSGCWRDESVFAVPPALLCASDCLELLRRVCVGSGAVGGGVSRACAWARAPITPAWQRSSASRVWRVGDAPWGRPVDLDHSD